MNKINLSLENILEAKRNSNSAAEAARYLGVSPQTFARRAKEFGVYETNQGLKGGKKPINLDIDRRTYSCNDFSFSELTSEGAYWLGFIAADGCIVEGKKQNRLSIGLATKDFEHLNIFKNDINFDGSIRNTYVKNTYKNEEKKFEMSILNITSQKISDDLYKNFNITPRKSLTLLPPNLSDTNLIDAFICGYIDGDGSVYLYKDNVRNVQDTLVITMLGTYEVICWIKERFTQIIGKELGTIKKHHNSEKNTYSYRITNMGAREIFKHFYNLNVPKLKRKWTDEIYEYCINYKKRNPICRRKGVNVFDLDGNLIKHFDLINDARDFTGVSIGRISDMCKMNDSKHQAKGYMFSRDETMEKYEPSPNINKKYLK